MTRSIRAKEHARLFVLFGFGIVTQLPSCNCHEIIDEFNWFTYYAIFRRGFPSRKKPFQIPFFSISGARLFEVLFNFITSYEMDACFPLLLKTFRVLLDNTITTCLFCLLNLHNYVFIYVN